MKQFNNIQFDAQSNGIYQLTIDRPKQLNALSKATITEIDMAISQLQSDNGARALLITGSGNKAFVAGADITEFVGMQALEARDFASATQSIFQKLEKLAIPVVAIVNGYALGGGCELAMACDWIIATENAKFGQPEVNLGLIPGFGGTQRLLRRVGKSMALDLCLTGRMISAQEALRIGLISQVISSEALETIKSDIAKIFSETPPIAIKLAKEAIMRGENMGLEEGCALEAEMFGLCFSTDDQSEGVEAFLEKRKPNFIGK